MRMASVEGRHVAVKKYKVLGPFLPADSHSSSLVHKLFEFKQRKMAGCSLSCPREASMESKTMPTHSSAGVVVSGVPVPSYQSCIQPSSRHRSHSSPISCLPSWYESSSAQQNRCLPILPPGQSSQPPPNALLWSDLLQHLLLQNRSSNMQEIAVCQSLK